MMTPTPFRLGPSRLRILAIIQDRLEAGRQPPSERELAEALGMWKNAVNGHLSALIRFGFLGEESSSNGSSRGYRALTLRCRIELTEEGRRRAAC